MVNMSNIQLYDHRKRIWYSLNFSKWIEPFNDGSNFFNCWYQKLYTAYTMLNFTANTTDDCFVYAYTSNGIPLLINFNIGHIYSQCGKEQLLYLHKTKASLHEFSIYPQYSKYVFHPAFNHQFLSHAVSDFPVLCCMAPIQNHNGMLVIDGNHRITIKKRFHIKRINVFEYQINSAYDFANIFEYNIFQFLLEYNNRKI